MVVDHTGKATLRIGRLEFTRLGWALAVSLAAHLVFWGGYAVAKHFDRYPGRDGFLLRNIASSLDAHTDDNTLKQILDWSLSAKNASDMAIVPTLESL